MSSLPKLVDAILTSWTKSLEPPYGTGEFSSAKDKATDCNRFVQAVLTQFGYNKMQGLLANQMFDAFELNGDWLEVEGEVAQAHANNGALVVAAWKHPEGGHGHVCMIRPGNAEPSGSWGVSTNSVPKVANVSEPNLCRVDAKASYAFGKDRRPKYFVMKVMA